MNFWEAITRSNFMIKLKSWEYWPFGIVQLPLFIYFAWLSLRARSFIFFSASNPGIVMGGMFGESKYDVLTKIPRACIPNTLLVKTPINVEQLEDILQQNGFQYPVIFKPDIGERGFRVKRIHNTQEADVYLQTAKGDFLIQELVELPLEFGVFYVRHPHELKGRVTSITMKEMLSVTGNGQSTLQQLILAKDRAKLQWDNLKITFSNQLQDVIPAEKKIELVSIGNHCLGTTFLNGNHLINDKLSETFDAISKQIEGFYFGRFDLRCATLPDLYEGRVKIMELNGCGAEPAHIYQPGFPLSKALPVLFTHWRTIFLIARANKQNGTPYTSLRDARQYYRKFKNATAV